MIYFDNAATTFPKPKAVTDEVFRCINKYCANPGRASHAPAIESASRVYECRSLLSGFLGAGAPENVVITPNTTYALNLALFSLIPYGAHVITSNAEHNSVLRPLAELKRRYGVTVSEVNVFLSESELISQISKKISSRTKAVVMSHSSNAVSHTVPVSAIGKICEKYGLYFILDCAQSAGLYSINMKRDGITAVCLPSHKALYGIQGAGACCFSPSLDTSKLRSTVFGGNGVESKSELMPELLPERFEAGTLCVPAIASLCEGIKFVEAVGTDAVLAHEEQLCSVLREALGNMSRITLYGDGIGTNVLFNLDGMNCEECAEYLDSQGICVRAGMHCAPGIHKYLGTYETGAVRVSFGYFNTLKQVQTLIKVLSSAP